MQGPTVLSVVQNAFSVPRRSIDTSTRFQHEMPMRFYPCCFLFLGLLMCAPLAAAEDPEVSEEVVPEPKPAAKPGTEVEGDEIWLDRVRNKLYGWSHGSVVWADNKFVDETKQEVIPTPPSRFRIGLIAGVELKPEGDIKFAPDADFGADVDVPNLEERMKLFITTRDPNALPGTDVFDQDNDLRVGGSRDFFENWRTSAGVKAKWPPEVFVDTKWTPRYKLGPHWSLFPEAKVFWNTDDKFGGSTSVTVGRWKNRWLLRQSLSGKITQNDAEEDDKRSTNPDNVQFGKDGGGVRWQSNTMFGYVTELLTERDYGRMVNGEDVAKGYGIRGNIFGNQVDSTQAKVTLFIKRPLYKDFMFYVISPEVVWKQEESWDEEWVLRVGVDMLLWGDETYRAAP